MGRKSVIDLLPAKKRAAIDKLLQAPELTLDELVALVEIDLGVVISRSALGRRKQNFAEASAKIRETREVAQAFAQDLGASLADETGRHLVEILHTLIFRVTMAKAGDDDDDDVKELMQLAKALKDLQSAQNLSIRREADLRGKIVGEAAAAAETAGKEAGLSADTIEAIKQRILGVRDGGAAPA